MRSPLALALIFPLFACSPPQPPDELKADDAGTEVPDAGAKRPDAGCHCTVSEYCAAGLCLLDTTNPLLTVTASAGSTSGTLRLTGTASDSQTALTPVELQLNGISVGTASVISGAWSLQVRKRACSTRSRSLIPRQADRAFHGKLITRSTRS